MKNSPPPISREKYILTVLGEECAEVAKVASKAVRFGMDSAHPRDPDKIANKHLIVDELNDIMAMVWELNENYGLGFSQNRKLMEAKRKKVDQQYTDLYGGPSMVPPPDPPKQNKMEVPVVPTITDAMAKLYAA